MSPTSAARAGRGSEMKAASVADSAVMLRAVLFDVDFTLARPGPELMPDGYVECAARHGVVLDLLGVDASAAAMVGDTLEDDIDGALALGMRAVLVDRLGIEPGFEPRIRDLGELPAALGLPSI